jgi:hypothetical protein
MTISANPTMTKLPESREWFLVRDKAMPPRNGLDGYTLGEIRYGVIDSQRVCYTLEDEDNHLEDGNGKPYRRSAIPTGRYRITIPGNGNYILINHVPGFFHAEIRTGNALDEGDVAVGDSRTLAGVGITVPALARLITELRRLTMAGVAVYLNVSRLE